MSASARCFSLSTSLFEISFDGTIEVFLADRPASFCLFPFLQTNPVAARQDPGLDTIGTFASFKVTRRGREHR